jgi:hypothetical protein
MTYILIEGSKILSLSKTEVIPGDGQIVVNASDYNMPQNIRKNEMYYDELEPVEANKIKEKTTEMLLDDAKENRKYYIANRMLSSKERTMLLSDFNIFSGWYKDLEKDIDDAATIEEVNSIDYEPTTTEG